MAPDLIGGSPPDNVVANDAFEAALRHSGVSPPGWLWLHGPLQAEEPSPQARDLAGEPDELTRRCRVLLEALAGSDGGGLDELLRLHDEARVILTAGIERLVRSIPASAADAPIFPELARRFEQHVEIPLLLLELRGEHVDARVAFARIFEAFEMAAVDLARGGSVTARTWRACEEIARGSVSLP